MLISERRKQTRREAKRRSTQRAFFQRHIGKQNNVITRELLILAMLFLEEKFNIFRFTCRTDIRDERSRLEPARPGPTRHGPVRHGQDAI